MNEEFIIEAASRSDEAAILDLLTATGLPHDGATDHLDGFIVARDESGDMVACAAIERHGEIGLLRSVAVAPHLQKSGLGSRLVSEAIGEARKKDVQEIVLLTTDARDFFARRFAFSETNRAEYDETLKNSPEWALPRCSSACVMKLCLNDDESDSTGDR
jgi:N-acetylglutamate synthase-like GNAT family acetyltransferase